MAMGPGEGAVSQPHRVPARRYWWLYVGGSSVLRSYMSLSQYFENDVGCFYLKKTRGKRCNKKFACLTTFISQFRGVCGVGRTVQLCGIAPDRNTGTLRCWPAASPCPGPQPPVTPGPLSVAVDLPPPDTPHAWSPAAAVGPCPAAPPGSTPLWLTHAVRSERASSLPWLRGVCGLALLQLACPLPWVAPGCFHHSPAASDAMANLCTMSDSPGVRSRRRDVVMSWGSRTFVTGGLPVSVQGPT